MQLRKNLLKKLGYLKTMQEIEKYEQAYYILENIYYDICCSDADFDDRPYYDIIEINN